MSRYLIFYGVVCGCFILDTLPPYRTVQDHSRPSMSIRYLFLSSWRHSSPLCIPTADSQFPRTQLPLWTAAYLGILRSSVETVVLRFHGLLSLMNDVGSRSEWINHRRTQTQTTIRCTIHSHHSTHSITHTNHTRHTDIKSIPTSRRSPR